MLWHKGWLESRFRWLFTLAFMMPMLWSLYSNGPNAKGMTAVRVVFGTHWILAAAVCVLVAGAGIVTQPSLQAMKGIHGSMLYTLSLPVSRLRLLAVRAGLGWFEMACSLTVWYAAMWLLLPALRASSAPWELGAQVVAMIVCATAIYAVPVLLATFLDDQWRVWGSAVVVGSLYWVSNHTLPDSANIFRAMSEGSPLLAHSMPWTAMLCAIALAAVLFLGALKIVQHREY